MARQKTNLTPEEKLVKVTEEIVKYEELLVVLKEQKDSLEKEIKIKQMTELYDIIQASGKTIEDIRLMLE